MTTSRHTFARAGVLTLAVLALAACGESTAPLNVTPEQLESMGDAVAAEIEAGVMQLTAQDVMSTSGGAPAFARVPTSSPMLSRSLSRSLSFSRSGSASARVDECGVPSQNPPTDTDGDQVPDNLSVTFSLPACHYAQEDGAMDLTGVMRISDPQPATAGAALNFALDNFRLSFSGSEGTFSVLRDGSAAVSATTGGLSQTLDWSEVAEISGFPRVTADINWTASFAAAQGQTITAGQPLPDGAYQANGSVGYRQGNRTAAFSVTTLAPLQYSAECAAGMATGATMTPFTSGRVRVGVSGQEGRGFVEVTYAACNMATVVLVAQ